MNWPSVLVAFWSNYAWSAGMIRLDSMQNTINRFIGSNGGNISMVGSAPTGQNNPGLGGGYQISQIYKRHIGSRGGALSSTAPTGMAQMIAKRAEPSVVASSRWYGQPVRPGLPLPGNYSGFAGTLAPEEIPASNAFMTGFLWFLIIVLVLVTATLLLKGTIELLIKWKILRTPNLNYYRSHWLMHAGMVVLRSCFIAFFMMLYLALFQFTLGGFAGVLAIAAVVFSIFTLGLLGVAVYALYYRLRHDRLVADSARLNVERGIGDNPSTLDEKGSPKFSIPFRRFCFSNADSDLPHVHDDTDFTNKFGWLSARFRRSKWWFFAFWLVYELVRACFYGGAAGESQTQVFGLLAWEILSLVIIVWMRPFESNRLNFIMVYALGFSKVASVALSSAFDARFGLDRILTTVIGIVLIVIQGILTILLMICIAIGAVSSYMSVMRYRAEIRPRSWNKTRDRYFEHIAFKTTDLPRPPEPTPPPEPEAPKEPYFSITAVRREPKIEDSDPDTTEELTEAEQSHEDLAGQKSPSRTLSMRSSHSVLPYGARRHRTSWSTRDFMELEQPATRPSERMSLDEAHEVASRHRAASLRGRQRPALDNLPATSSTIRQATGAQAGHRRTKSNPLRPINRRQNSTVAEEETTDSNLMPKGSER
jgi:hypothetical protein